MRSTVDNFVIENVGKKIEIVNLGADPEYAALLKLEADRKLKAKFPNDRGLNTAARNYHTMDMMGSGSRQFGDWKYNDGVLMVEPSDEDGTLELLPEQEELAKLLIKVLRSQAKRDVKLAKHSRQFTDGWDYINLIPVSTPKRAIKEALAKGLPKD